MKHKLNLTKLLLSATFLFIGCNGGDATYTDGTNRVITTEGIKGKLSESRSLDNEEKRFVAFHVHEFSVADWAKILSKPEADVRGTDVGSFSSSYWNESNLTKAEFQALLAENDGCSTTLLQGSGYEYTYRLPGCVDFNNASKPDIVIPDVTYGLYFYNQIAKPEDWTMYSSITLSFQTTQLAKLLNLSNNTIRFRNERLQRGFELKVKLIPEGPTSYEPATLYSLKSPSPVVLEKSSNSLYIAHYLESQFISNIYRFSDKNKNFVNVNVIRVPRIVSTLIYDATKTGDDRYIWEKPAHIAYQNANDERVKGYESAAGFFMGSAVQSQYVIFMGLEPAKEFAISEGCTTVNECKTLASYVLDHVVAHENGHLLLTKNHATDPSHLMYPSTPARYPVANVGTPFTDNLGNRISELRFTTAGWTF